nr:hypothetical protein [Tanacetum cinerariifolium]
MCHISLPVNNHTANITFKSYLELDMTALLALPVLAFCLKKGILLRTNNKLSIIFNTIIRSFIREDNLTMEAERLFKTLFRNVSTKSVTGGDTEMDLVAFIRHSDPTKVQIGERELEEREVKLLKMTEGRTMPLSPPLTTALKYSDSIDKLFNGADQEYSVERGDASGSTYPPKMLRGDYQSLLPNTSGKSLAAFRGMVSEGSAIPSGVTKPLIATFVAPVSDVGPLNSVSMPKLRTCPPHVRYVVSSYGSHHSGSYSEATSFVRSPAADALVMAIVVTTTIVADIAAFSGSKARDASKYLENIGDFASTGGANTDASSISKLNKPSTSVDSFYTSQSVDTKTMHHIYVPRWKVTNDSILEDPYVCRDLTDQRDAEIAHLKSLLSLKESEAAEAIRLWRERDVMSEKMATLESANAAKEAELASLSSQVSKLTSDLSGFELSHDELDSKKNSLELSSLGNAWRPYKMSRQRLWFPEYLQALGRAIGCAINKGIQDGLKAGIDHGQAGRDLSVIEAYDPSAEAKYIYVVNALGAVDFYFLSELESKKDSCIVDLMDSLRIDGILAEIPGAENLQPSPKQLMLLIHRSENDVVIGETSLSSSPVVNLRFKGLRKSGLTQRNHGPNNDFLNKTPSVAAYLLALRRIALAFFLSYGRIPSTSTSEIFDFFQVFDHARLFCYASIKASYSASLLVASNLNLRAYANSIPSGFVIIRLAPEPSMHDDPSVNSIYGSGSTSSSSMAVS